MVEDQVHSIKVAPASPYCSGRIDRLVQSIVGGARGHISAMFEHGCVALNGEIVLEPWHRLRAGDRVKICYQTQRRYVPKPRPRVHRGFAVLYEDRDCVVVDKAAEMLTVPTRRNEGNTLIDLVGDYVRRQRRGDSAFVVHRLDRGVSGVLVFGKSAAIASALRDQFASRKPDRRYAAIVAGEPPRNKGELRSLLATDENLNRFSTKDAAIGQLAITRFRVLDRMGDCSLLEVRLETGRRNQIRVQFADFGHPVLGDQRYGGERARHRAWPASRIALHAKTLEFRRPVDHEIIRIESRYPSEMVKFLTRERS